MLYTTTTTENIRLTKANNINTYTAHNDGLTTISESSHVVTPAKGKSRVRASKGPRTSVQNRSRNRSRWLDSLYNNYADASMGVDSLRCAYFTGRFDHATKSCTIAQNRVAKWINNDLLDKGIKIECYTSIVEYDAGGDTHVHIVLKADKSVLNHGINGLHNALIESFKAYGTGHSERIYDLDGLGRYMMMSDVNKAKTVKQAVQDERQAKENYNNVKGLNNVPAGIKQRAKKDWRQSHMAKKKAVAKAYEKHNTMRKSYGQKHGIKVRSCRPNVWAFIVEHGQYLGSTTTRISSDSHLINVVKRDVYRLNDSDTRELQRLLGAIKAYQNANKVVAA